MTETWLNCNIKDRDILNNEYTIFRKDRAIDKRGGGVLLAVNSNITSREVSDIPVGDSEILLVEVSPSHCSEMFFVICYRPPSAPSAPVNVFTSQLDTIVESATKTYKKVCLLGDLNISDVHWSDCPSSKKLEQDIFCDILNVYVLVQLNTIPSTKHGNILDLVISNIPHLLSPVEECDLSFMSDHVVIFAIHDKVK